MLIWFKENAPIRRKFDVMAFVYTSLCAAPVLTMGLAAGGRGANATSLAVGTAAVIATLLVALMSKKLICDPYVNTVVRMEGLAAGDLRSPIHYTGHNDCVGRMTRAMAVFMRNAETASGVAEREQVVGALGTGLSKLARLVDVFARRPQVQERLTTQVADSLVRILEPRGAIVVLEAEHLCMSMRGVRKPGAFTVTSAVRGIFKENAATRAEVMSLLGPRSL